VVDGLLDSALFTYSSTTYFITSSSISSLIGENGFAYFIGLCFLSLLYEPFPTDFFYLYGDGDFYFFYTDYFFAVDAFSFFYEGIFFVVDFLVSDF
jgi:hypothetical protein